MNRRLKLIHALRVTLALGGSLIISSPSAEDSLPHAIFQGLNEAKVQAATEHPKISQVILASISRIRGHVSNMSPDESGVPLDLSVLSTPFVKVSIDGRIQVYIRIGRWGGAEAKEIKRIGAEIDIVNEEIGIVQAKVPYQRLEGLAQIDFVTRIIPPSYGEFNSGSVATEGDAILGSDDVRALGIDGSEVRIGVISGGVDGLSFARLTNDLPSVEVIQARSGDAEGTAMLEIVHDIAPGATLGFCGLPSGTSLDFMQCVNLLRYNFSADIIVDDIVFFADPYFEDGYTANTVRSAVDSGALYVTSAGNASTKHYQGTFLPFHAGSGVLLHDFAGASASNPDIGLDFHLLPGESLNVWLQWSEPFGAACTDHDLVLLDEQLNLLAESVNSQNCDDDPLEYISYTNPSLSATLNVRVSISREEAGVNHELEMFYSKRPDEYLVSSGSIFGHAGLPGVITVGSINAADSGHDTIAPYSSRGNSEIFFPDYQVRGKPDIVAIDGVSVTGAGGFPTPFFGTSAAAPHVAGIAALLKSAVPSVNALKIHDVILSSATALGVPSPNTTYGFGRINALAAYHLLTDEDNDGVLIGEDNCPETPNSDQLNTDGDNVGDACDPDDDNDSVPDALDAFPLNPQEAIDTDLDGIGNNTDTDDDNDGLSDAEEVALGSDPLKPDTDGDTVQDVDDNCPVDANPEQIDVDGDGLGDVCDHCQRDPENICDQICFPVKSSHGKLSVICL